LFYNTGISTYLWIVTNRKEEKRKGKVQLIDATSYFSKMRKSLGNKRNEITDQHKTEIVQLYGSFRQGKNVKIFKNEEFGYNRITVERPLKLNFCVNEERLSRLKETSHFQALAESKKRKKDKNTSIISKEEQEGRKLQEKMLAALKTLETGQLIQNQEKFEKKLEKALSDHSLDLKAPLYKAILDSLSERYETADTVMDSKGNPLPDSELRDNENVPLGESITEYMKREVLPYVPDAWIDESKTKKGYEISFNRYFYVYQPPRPVEEIEKDLEKIEEEIAALLRGSR
jgi:type I restriction enzyme M protein